MDLKSIADFLGPFRDLLVERLKTKPKLPVSQRQAALVRVEHYLERGEISEAGILSEDLFGERVQGEILNELWTLPCDRPFMVERLVAAGTTRTFSWHLGHQAIWPGPAGTDGVVFSGCVSFLEARKLATNRALLLLLEIMVIVPSGMFFLDYMVGRATSIVGVLVPSIVVAALAMLLVLGFGGAIRDEARFKVANALWSDYLSLLPESKRQKVQEEIARATRSDGSGSQSMWVNLFVAISIPAFGILNWIGPWIVSFPPIQIIPFPGIIGATLLVIMWRKTEELPKRWVRGSTILWTAIAGTNLFSWIEKLRGCTAWGKQEWIYSVAALSWIGMALWTAFRWRRIHREIGNASKTLRDSDATETAGA